MLPINPQRVLGEWLHAAAIALSAVLLWIFAANYLYMIISAYVTMRLLKMLFILSKSLLVHKLMPEIDLSNLKDSWTVVTGGTDGIGKAYVRELAQTRGIRNFYLIGRNLDKLRAFSDELCNKYDNAQIKIAVFDFDSSDLKDLPEELSSLDVGILLNFAGLAPEVVGTLVEQEDGMASKIMRVNLMSCIKMNELILPGMLKRNRGIIVNMASMTGWRPLPYTSSYPASKAAISFFSDSLADEFRSSNVRIQCLVPMLVATHLAKYDKSEANEIFVVSAENFARQAVHAIGTFELICGCWQHDVQIALGTLLSFWLFKQLFVPFVMLGIHKKRVDDYQKKRSK